MNHRGPQSLTEKIHGGGFARERIGEGCSIPRLAVPAVRLFDPPRPAGAATVAAVSARPPFYGASQVVASDFFRFDFLGWWFWMQFEMGTLAISTNGPCGHLLSVSTAVEHLLLLAHVHAQAQTHRREDPSTERSACARPRAVPVSRTSKASWFCFWLLGLVQAALIETPSGTTPWAP